MYILTCASCLVTKKCCLICASNQNTCFGVRCRVGAGVNSCEQLHKYCVSSSSSCKTLIRSYTGGYAAKGRKKNSVYMCTWVVNEKDCIKPEQRKYGKVLNAVFGWKWIVMLASLFQV